MEGFMHKIDLEKRQAWKQRVEDWLTSGISVKKWCENNKIPEGTFYYWKVQFLPKLQLSKNSFIELPKEKTTAIEIEIKGVKIFLKEDFDVQTLSRLLKMLRG
jgi:ethanolamine utilization cobalamin adenosyltransferase